ncbi:MAG: phage tail protein I [Paracoccaceae bacterium]|nr:MAG: phage tail protein I [Paracoccaceae bacterium]
MIDFDNLHLSELLPKEFLRDPDAYALVESMNEILQVIHQKVAAIDPLTLESGEMLDFTAGERRVDFYDEGVSDERKQELIRKSDDIHRKKGTPFAVETVLSTILEKSEVLEWFQYGGQPFRFKITIDTPVPDEKGLPNVFRLINRHKRKTAVLESLLFKQAKGIYYEIFRRRTGLYETHPERRSESG